MAPWPHGPMATGPAGDGEFPARLYARGHLSPRLGLPWSAKQGIDQLLVESLSIGQAHPEVGWWKVESDVHGIGWFDYRSRSSPSCFISIKLAVSHQTSCI